LDSHMKSDVQGLFPLRFLTMLGVLLSAAPAGRAEGWVRLLNGDFLQGSGHQFEGVDLYWRTAGQDREIRIPGAYLDQVNFPEAAPGGTGTVRVLWNNGDELQTELPGLEGDRLALRFLDGSTRHTLLDGVREIRFAPGEDDRIFDPGLRQDDWSTHPKNQPPPPPGQGLRERTEGLGFPPRQTGRLDVPPLEGSFMIEWVFRYPEEESFACQIRLFQPRDSSQNQNKGITINLNPQRVLVSEFAERTNRHVIIKTPGPEAGKPSHLRIRMYFDLKKASARMSWNGQDLGAWALEEPMRKLIRSGTTTTLQATQREMILVSFYVLRWNGELYDADPELSDGYPHAVTPRHAAPFAGRWTGFSEGRFHFETKEGTSVSLMPAELEQLRFQPPQGAFLPRTARDVRMTHRSSRSQLTFSLTGWRDGMVSGRNPAWTEELLIPLRLVDRLDFNIYRPGLSPDPYPPRPLNFSHRNR